MPEQVDYRAANVRLLVAQSRERISISRLLKRQAEALLRKSRELARR